MSGIFYAIFVVGILVVIHWYIANERVGPNSDGSEGVLAMRSGRESDANAGAAGGDGRKPRLGPKQASTKSMADR
jgi:hypothetical protein